MYTIYMFIYKITNTVNGKVYIGQTSGDVQTRWISHLSAGRTGRSGCVKLMRAMKKHGLDAFKIDTIARAATHEELDALEIAFIKKYNSTVEGYNLALGGRVIHKHSDASRKKMSDSHKGLRPNRNEQQQRVVSESMRKLHHGMSDEGKLRVGAASKRNLTGKKQSEETIQKRINSQAKSYEITYPDGSMKIIRNLNQFCRDNSLSIPCMFQTLKSNNRQHKGYVVKRV